MEPLNIEGTNHSPKVIFNKYEGIFKISGRSLPENAHSFYEPIIEWFSKYLNNPNPTTILTFELEYFNSVTSKYIFEIIRMMLFLLDNKLEAKVNWCYPEDDDDILETGQIYENLLKMPFVFKTIVS